MKYLRYVALGALLGLAGCGSLFGDKDNSPKPVKVPSFDEKVNLREVGSTSVAGAKNAIFEPVWSQGEVWAAGINGEAIAWNPTTDAERELFFNDKLSAGVDANANLLLAATRKGKVLALDLNGQKLWQYEVKAEILSRPRVVGDSVLVRSQDGRLIALAADTGQLRWQSDVKNPPLVLHVPMGMASADGVVYAAFPGGKLRAYESKSGTLLWESWVAQPKGATELERVTDVVGDPWIDGSQVCAVSFQGKLACFDRSKGESRWSRDFSSVSGLDGDHRYVYATDANSAIVAFDKVTGRQIWKQDKLYARHVTRPTVFGTYVAVADYQGKVYVLDSETGEFRGMASVGDEVRAPLVVADERLLVQDVDGGITLFSLQ